MANDDKTYKPLRGGIQGEVESSSAVAGTLGCLAETNRPGEPRRIVFLSVAHLLYGGRKGNVLGLITHEGSRACHTNACSKCSTCCSDDFGKSLRGEFTQNIDAAIATIYAQSRYLREIEGLGVVRGTHTITAAEAHGRNQRYRVRKRGIATRITEGTVRLLDFAVNTKTDAGEFERRALNQILVQPRTLVAVPITSIQQDGVIRANGAQFQANGVTKDHFIEISGPTRNRNLFRVHDVRSETEIVVGRRGTRSAAELIPEDQPPFTPVTRFLFEAGVNGVRAPGLAANYPNIRPLDMAEITGSTSNNGLFQIRPLGEGAINDRDEMAVSEQLTNEPAGGSQVRGVIFIRVREEKFNDNADSGAVLINDDQEVVGLLAGKSDQETRPDLSGYGFGAPIQAITTALGINILTAQVKDEEQIVAATEGEPRPGGVVAMNLREGERAVLARAQEELFETESGRKYAELASVHRPEVQTLINNNRRVAVAWQRNGGPLMFQLALNAVEHPDAAIPSDINGRPLASCMTNILQALDQHGSASLKSDIARFGKVWTLLPGKSFNELKSDLRKRSVGSAHG